MTVEQLFKRSKRKTTGRFAVDKKGHSVSPHSRSAISWCLAGAVFRCYRNPKRSDVLDRIYSYVSTTGKFGRELDIRYLHCSAHIHPATVLAVIYQWSDAATYAQTLRLAKRLGI